ncbi:MAG: hypothetical protein O7E53_00910, partial [Alphaproteobacteria bacterium]|nr:hypothetical protein [Alphaproteobacteria bacterium]
MAVIIGCVVYLMVNGSGEFFYTLDDPYIHMALADNIKDGHYGINANEVSSPSSSILYPFILVPFSYFSIEKYAPLVINIFCTFVSLALLKKIISLILSDDPTLAVRMAWIAFFVLLMSNGIGVIFTGMEHSIQLLLCLFIILGVVRLSRSDTVPAYLCAACVLLPLIRFEGLALTSGTLLLLLYRKKFTPFLIVSSVLFAVLLGYGLYMNSLGLPMVPSSILVKISVNGAPANSSFLNSMFVYSVVNFILSLKHQSFIILIMTLFLIIASDGVV